jgi:hypothetical protein
MRSIRSKGRRKSDWLAQVVQHRPHRCPAGVSGAAFPQIALRGHAPDGTARLGQPEQRRAQDGGQRQVVLGCSERPAAPDVLDRQFLGQLQPVGPGDLQGPALQARIISSNSPRPRAPGSGNRLRAPGGEVSPFRWICVPCRSVADFFRRRRLASAVFSLSAPVRSSGSTSRLVGLFGLGDGGQKSTRPGKAAKWPRAAGCRPCAAVAGERSGPPAAGSRGEERKECSRGAGAGLDPAL